MNGISRASGMTNMPVNCGMKGMHESAAKNETVNNTQKLDTASKKDNMPVNCGMKGMHNNSSNDNNQSNIESTIGSKIDMKA